MLTEKHADVSVLNRRGQSALHLAGRAGLHDVLGWLSVRVCKELVELRDVHGATASNYAQQAGAPPDTSASQAVASANELSARPAAPENIAASRSSSCTGANLTQAPITNGTPVGTQLPSVSELIDDEPAESERFESDVDSPQSGHLPNGFADTMKKASPVARSSKSPKHIASPRSASPQHRAGSERRHDLDLSGSTEQSPATQYNLFEQVKRFSLADGDGSELSRTNDFAAGSRPIIPHREPGIEELYDNDFGWSPEAGACASLEGHVAVLEAATAVATATVAIAAAAAFPSPEQEDVRLEDEYAEKEQDDSISQLRARLHAEAMQEEDEEKEPDEQDVVEDPSLEDPFAGEEYF